MVVLSFNAIIADAAMVCPRRTPDVAALAVFGGDFHCGALRGGGNNHSPFSGWRADVEGVIMWGWWGKGVQIAGEDLRHC